MLIPGFDEKHLPAFGNNRTAFLIWGIALVILGLFAISAATFTTLLSVVVIGFVIFIGGIVMGIDTITFWRKQWSGFFLHIIFTILYLAVGIMLIRNPVEGSISLTLLLGLFYIVVGIFRLAFVPTFRAPQWGWGWFNGIITLILGILIITSWPASSLFIIGLFVGIDLLFSGWTYIMLAAAAKRFK